MINYDLEAQQAAALDDNTYTALAEYVKKQDDNICIDIGHFQISIDYGPVTDTVTFELHDWNNSSRRKIILRRDGTIASDYRQELIPVFTLAVALHNQVMKSEKGLMNDKA